jgi:chromosomal replication initiator protein
MPQSTNIELIWGEVLEIIRAELNTPSFKTWFEHTVPLDLTDEGFFVVGVQNEFARSWLEDRYSQRLSSALRQVAGADLSVRIVVDGFSQMTPSAPEDSPDEVVVEPAPEQARIPEKVVSDEFNQKYTFDSFIVGESNAFARNAALAVAEQPGLKFNPLFIWGGPGLGKTHLLQAIANYVTMNYPHKKVMYVTSEAFTNDFLNSISSKTSDSFRQKYRTVDVLLIDDIQFLEKKEGTQEQFFNTFNELHGRGKAVVLSSDRPPKDINMNERYQSRFAWGLQADIQPPNYETRLAILRQFADSQKVPYEDNALSFLAEKATPNIREMEGALTRIMAYRDLAKKPTIDISIAEQVTRDLFPERHRQVSVSTIQREVCRYYNLSHSDLIGGKRSQAIVYPRQVAMYLSRELTDLSLPKIGDEFGGRDHTTVIHATAKIQKLMSAQRDVWNEIQTLTNTIKHKN